jgi:hypothetical protein
MGQTLIDFTPETLFDTIVFIAFFFFCSGLLFMFSLYLLRIVKSFRKKTEQRVREQSQRIVNTIIINDSMSDRTAPEAAFSFQIQQLKLLLGHSTIRKNVFIKLLLDIKRNLSGSSAATVQSIYKQMQLEEHSRKKLRSLRWEVVGQGIRELGEMHCTTRINDIRPFINSRNELLRQEAFMALVRLQSGDEKFSFLDAYTETITSWMTLNIHAFLLQMDSRELPDFSRWFHSKNESVRLFTLQMARQFRSTKALPRIAELVNHVNENVAVLAIETLGEMDAYPYSDVLLSLVKASSIRKVIAATKALGRIGEPEITAEALSPLCDHPVYEVRYVAAQSLLQLGAAGRDRIMEHQSSVSGIIKHLQEPLLQ